MKQILKCFLAYFALLNFSSCNNVSKTNKVVETPKIQTPDTKSVEEVIKTADAAKDVVSCGGSAGKITLAGAFANESNGAESFLTIKQYSGKGWRAECKVTKAEPIERIPELSESTLQGLEKLKSDNKYILVGCSPDTIPMAAFKGMTETQPSTDEKKQITSIAANTVVLCGEKKIDFGTPIVSIQANTLWVRGFGYTLTGSSISTFSLIANNFAFSGSFGIYAIGAPSTTTVLAGPTIFLGAKQFVTKPSASTITSAGSDYKDERSKSETR